MGVRGELFSTMLSCEGRTYFFNVKENRMGDLFLSIVESKKTDTGEFDRRSIVLFQDNVPEFTKSLSKAIDAMNKASPSRKAPIKSAKPRRAKNEKVIPRDDGRPVKTGLDNDEKPRHYIEIKARRPKFEEEMGGRVPAEKNDKAAKKGKIKVVKVSTKKSSD